MCKSVSQSVIQSVSQSVSKQQTLCFLDSPRHTTTSMRCSKEAVEQKPAPKRQCEHTVVVSCKSSHKTSKGTSNACVHATHLKAVSEAYVEEVEVRGWASVLIERHCHHFVPVSNACELRANIHQAQEGVS